ncbi:MAG: hypothetical protein NC311_11315 [Muribaculaceae bacterium]|nr:hypothetical protein [Muribaculaceae bacterium]
METLFLFMLNGFVFLLAAVFTFNCLAWFGFQIYKNCSNIYWQWKKNITLKKYGPGYLLDSSLYHRWACLTKNAIQYIKDADVQKEYISSFNSIRCEVHKGGSEQCQK